MVKIIVVLSCTGIIIASGLIHGAITDRWADSEDLDNAAKRLQYVPLEVDNWQGEILDDKAGKGSGLSASISVRYRHNQSGNKYTVFLGCGKPGPLSIHTPDVCYTASGFDSEAKSKESFRQSGVSDVGEMYTARFKKSKGGDQTNLRIYWTWYANGKWTAPENPRMTYHRQAILYKLYVLHEMDNFNDAKQSEVRTDLLPKLTKAIEKHVFNATP